MRAAQGVLEYVEDKVRFLGALHCAYPRALQLLSYAIGDSRPPGTYAVPTTLNSRARLQGVLDALRLVQRDSRAADMLLRPDGVRETDARCVAARRRRNANLMTVERCGVCTDAGVTSAVRSTGNSTCKLYTSVAITVVRR